MNLRGAAPTLDPNDPALRYGGLGPADMQQFGPLVVPGGNSASHGVFDGDAFFGPLSALRALASPPIDSSHIPLTERPNYRVGWNHAIGDAQAAVGRLAPAPDPGHPALAAGYTAGVKAAVADLADLPLGGD